MNYITILEPKWSTKQILVADYKIGTDNEIVIKHHDFPEPFYMSGEKLRSYPKQIVKSKQGNEIEMRCVPLEKLSTDLTIEEL